MNEQIQKLYKQAAEYAQQQEPTDLIAAQVVWHTKFAELIVRECARIGELKEQGYCEYDPDISVGWYMRQHFGVEE